MAHSVIRSRRAHRLVFAALSASAAFLPGIAWAQCVASNATTIACTGTAAAYSNTSATGATVSVASGATVSAPLVIGTASGSTGNVLNNSGAISGTGGVFTVQFGNGSTINNGTSSLHTVSITSSGAVSGAGAISVGNNSTVNNFGTITSTAGTTAVLFGAAGTFNNDASAPAAVSGNIIFGTTNGAGASFNNANTAFGFTGTVGATGQIAVNNAGLWTGNFYQTTVGNSNVVTFNNGVSTPHSTTTGLIFTGIVSTQDVTHLTNYDAMFLYAGSGIGTAQNGTSTVVNNGSLTIGSTTSAAKVNINGDFTQNAGASLGMIILPAGTSVATAGTSFSQLNAVGGTMALNGTLALDITPGYYTTGATFQLLTADNGITGNFSAITSTSLPFISFVPVNCGGGNACNQATASGVTTITNLGTAGVVTTGGGAQAYELTVVRNGTYYQALTTNGVTATTLENTNELAIAGGTSHSGGLYPLVATAQAAVLANALTNDAITFVGEIDVLTVAQAQAFLDSVSPEGYLAYKAALHDQANAFTRSIALRMDDQNSSHDEDGWWFNTQGEFELLSKAGATNGYRSRDSLIGFVGGYDFSGPHHVFGAALNLSWDSLNYAPGSMHGHNRDFALAGYGAYDLGPLVFSGQIAYNMGQMSATKTITLGTVTRTAHGSASEHLLKATGTVGLNVLTGDYKLQPFAGIEYANGKIGGFTETNGGAADLTVAAMSANRTDLIAGVSFSRSSGTIRPYLRVAYRNQVGTGSSNTISAYFNGDNTTSFAVTGLPEARHELDGNIGVNWVFDDAGAIFFGAQATTRTAHTSVGLNVGLRLEF